MYNRIRDLREDKESSQEQLAKLLNVSQTTYSRYETDKNELIWFPAKILGGIFLL